MRRARVGLVELPPSTLVIGHRHPQPHPLLEQPSCRRVQRLRVVRLSPERGVARRNHKPVITRRCGLRGWPRSLCAKRGKGAAPRRGGGLHEEGSGRRRTGVARGWGPSTKRIDSSPLLAGTSSSSLSMELGDTSSGMSSLSVSSLSQADRVSSSVSAADSASSPPVAMKPRAAIAVTSCFWHT